MQTGQPDAPEAFVRVLAGSPLAAHFLRGDPIRKEGSCGVSQPPSSANELLNVVNPEPDPLEV